MAVLFVALFAVFLASFPARNADLWRHLAAGRDLAGGVVRLSPTWLYDLASYLVFSVAGGVGLVAVKALLCGAAAALVFRVSCAGGWRIALVVTGLAVLAMGTRLLLQPATVSVFFLAVTVWLLFREEASSPVTGSVWPGWRLVVLFAVWANVDGWFVLGLGVVALTWLGRLLDEQPAGGRGPALGRWAGGVGVLVAASCLSPSHVSGLRPPPELRAGVAALGEGAAHGASVVNSPFSRAYLNVFRESPAGLAYYPLLGLGLLSFVLNRSGWRWAWFLPWLGLAVVSGLQVRTVPFFAVVAGPVLAWNLQAVLARRGELPRVRPRLRYAAWGAAVVLAVAFLVCAWPGWLQGPPFEPRRWAVEQPTAMRQGADFLRRAHAAGSWAPGTRTLHASPDTASAFAWFCPEDRGVRDDEAVAGLLRTDEDGGGGRPRLRELGVNRVVVHAAEPAALPVLDRLLAAPEEWPVLHLRGGLVVFGWRDPARAGEGDPFRGWEVDFDRLAFRPEESETAPAGRPGSAGGRHWWEAFWRPAPPRPADRDEVTVLLRKADALQRSAPFRHQADWEAAQAAGLVGAAGGWVGSGGAIDAALRLTLLHPPPPEGGSTRPPPVAQLTFALQQRFVFDRGDAPVGLLYAAIRAARRAVAENPTDAGAHLALGQAYVRLLFATTERKWATRFPQLMRVRQVQAVAALNRAVLLNPKLPDAHLELGLLYRQVGCLDLAVRHLREYLRREPPREGDRRQGAIKAELDRLTEAVDQEAGEFEKESLRLSVYDRAVAAVQRGLGGKARDLLLASDVAAFGAQGTELELTLLLRTGRPDDVLAWLTKEVAGSLGDFTYHWLRAQALAAVGEYDAAHEELADMVGPGGWLPTPAQVGGEVGGLLAKALLDTHPGGPAFSRLAWRALSQSDLYRRVTQITELLARQCEALALQGMLALEAGNIDRARQAFRAALTFSPMEFSGRSVARECLELLDGHAGVAGTDPRGP